MILLAHAAQLNWPSAAVIIVVVIAVVWLMGKKL